MLESQASSNSCKQGIALTGARESCGCWSLSSTRLVFEVGVDPFFEFAAAVVGVVETDSEGVLRLSPGDVGSDPNAGQGEQRE